MIDVRFQITNKENENLIFLLSEFRDWAWEKDNWDSSLTCYVVICVVVCMCVCVCVFGMCIQYSTPKQLA